jgi:hypothetical protein
MKKKSTRTLTDEDRARTERVRELLEERIAYYERRAVERGQSG